MGELWPHGPLVLPHECAVDNVLIRLPEVAPPTLFGHLAVGNWSALVPGLVPAEQIEPLAVRMLDESDEFDVEHLHEVATRLFGRLAGTHNPDGPGSGWWPAQRLAATASTHWTSFVGWCAQRGTEPLSGPLWQIIGTVYGWLRALREPGGDTELTKLDQQIWAPPPASSMTEPERAPRHVQEEEAQLAMAALAEQMPGEQVESEWALP